MPDNGNELPQEFRDAINETIARHEGKLRQLKRANRIGSAGAALVGIGVGDIVFALINHRTQLTLFWIVFVLIGAGVWWLGRRKAKRIINSFDS